MPFASSGKTKRVLTHLQWCKSEEFQKGKETEVKHIMGNPDWENIAFIGEDFRMNLKADGEQHWYSLMNDLDSKLMTQKCKLILRDVSEPDLREFECEVDFVDLSRKLSGEQWERSNKGSTFRLKPKS